MSANSIIEKAAEFSRDLELVNAEGVHKEPVEITVEGKVLLGKTMRFLDSEIAETKEGILNEDIHEILDGFGDVAFIALNGIYKQWRIMGNDHATATLKVYAVMSRICTANLAKKNEDGTVTFIDGKVQKPKGWQEPKYDDLF